MNNTQLQVTANSLTSVLLDADTLDRGDMDFAVLYSTLPKLAIHKETTPDQLPSRLKDASIILSNKVVINRQTMENNPQIKLICVLATGTNNIDMDAAKEFGIEVKNVVAYGTPSVVQHVFSLILNIARSQHEYITAVREGDWSAQSKFCLLDYPITDLSTKTLGIIGHGELGQGVAKAASAFGLEVMISERKGQSPRAGRVAFDTVIAESDIISLHCPLTPDTEEMINRESLEKMKSSAWLINTARGGLVNEDDLAWALDHQVIEAAALDVLSSEPPPENHPLLVKHRRNLIITPHIAWATSMARQKVIDLTVENIKEFLNPK